MLYTMAWKSFVRQLLKKKKCMYELLCKILTQYYAFCNIRLTSFKTSQKHKTFFSMNYPAFFFFFYNYIRLRLVNPEFGIPTVIFL